MSKNLYTDKELFRLIAEGNEEAFEMLFDAYLPRLIPFARKLTDDWEAAREIVQETFLRLWLSRDKLESVDNPAGWIFTIASNQSYKYLRRKLLIDAHSQEALPEEDNHHPSELQELKILIHTAVGSLSDQRRKVFLLSREKGLTIPDIAAELGLSPNTVKNTLVSALKLVREFLESRGYLLPSVLLLYL